ncbi:transcriptional regulator, IclR family [Sanguibacter gelidistatuariae]|uniref:Transcriptional regulator, IclR family n=1 Tax=Sanguibacter gelidistatuariae TaxID=1814289 RepID=A0A1G6L4M3_9MICO|nr:IclR family transcriptional regulator [Sanguibacter gelidistatuariae]SDC38259.1 transcriptional regulator, IclR family [Sanguibacter gelidistatuariae]
MDTSATDGASPMGSVDKALLALQELSAAGAGGLALAQLAESLGLNKTSLHRTLAALRFRGFVDQDPVTGNYVLGAAAAALSLAFFSDENLPRLLQNALVTLCAQADELVHLGVLSGAEILYLDKVEPARPVRVWSAVGRRQPAATTALGRAILSQRHIDPATLAWYAGRHLPTDRLAEILSVAQTNGYATETEENEAGISCLAVPMLRDGAPVAAVSITAPSDRMTPPRRTELTRIIASELPALLPPGVTLPAALVTSW